MNGTSTVRISYPHIHVVPHTRAQRMLHVLIIELCLFQLKPANIHFQPFRLQLATPQRQISPAK